jgi:hypothetical protein
LHGKNGGTRLTSVETLPATVPIVAKAKQQYALGYLRAFLVVLVVAHHAALAYFPYAPPPNASLVTQPRWWPAFPVVDPLDILPSLKGGDSYEGSYAALSEGSCC